MSSNRLPLTTALAAIAMLAIGQASANERTGSVRLASLPAASPTLEAGTPTLAPFAHVVLCQQRPEECGSDGRGTQILPMTRKLTDLLRSVNASVNARITPRNDSSGPLGDAWTVSPRSGDCDDYAVTKRHELLRAGLPVGALRLLVVRTRAGEGHVVLGVRTDRGDLVLDNLKPSILEWRDTRLTMVKYQSTENSRRWLRPSGERIAARDLPPGPRRPVIYTAAP